MLFHEVLAGVVFVDDVLNSRGDSLRNCLQRALDAVVAFHLEAIEIIKAHYTKLSTILQSIEFTIKTAIPLFMRHILGIGGIFEYERNTPHPSTSRHAILCILLIQYGLVGASHNSI